MAEKTFAKRIQDIMGERDPKELTGGLWHGISYAHICIDKKFNFIDGTYPDKCDVKGNYFGKDKRIKYHDGAAHLNSSQVVCISFFKKFFERGEWETILLKTLKAVGVPITSEKIKYAVFEYEPDSKEKTNFDFFLVLDNSVHVSFEIKYTESEFGGISSDKKDPDKYARKWTEVYRKMVQECPYISCNEQEFYAKCHYQINRNICFAKDGDIVLFLTPKANDAVNLVEGREYIDSYTSHNPNIRNIYWEDVINALMKLIADEPELLDYYSRFKEKYIDIL